MCSHYQRIDKDVDVDVLMYLLELLELLIFVSESGQNCLSKNNFSIKKFLNYQISEMRKNPKFKIL